MPPDRALNLDLAEHVLWHLDEKRGAGPAVLARRIGWLAGDEVGAVRVRDVPAHMKRMPVRTLASSALMLGPVDAVDGVHAQAPSVV